MAAEAAQLSLLLLDLAAGLVVSAALVLYCDH